MTTARDGFFPILDNWELQISPITGNQTVTGEIYNDIRWGDGTPIRTSKVVEIDGNFLRTLNTQYLLAKPNGENND